MEAGDDRGRRGDRREMRRAGWLGRGEGMMRWRGICMYPGREPTPTQGGGGGGRRGGWVSVLAGHAAVAAHAWKNGLRSGNGFAYPGLQY